ncbi:outer membrane lipoprotein carrier protein LolA [Armatimonas sp.]|uniref:LolA family protein n=1 Tax=Armatimonas sp. TaxID=1872638 RepID=UPI003752CF26
MQETSADPAVKTELARCFATHHALKSFAVDVRVTSRGVPMLRSVPMLRNGVVQIALERPGRLRMEAQGALREAGICLLVASSNYIYEALSPAKTYRVKSIPADGDALTYGLQNNEILPLPFFSQLLVDKDGLEALLKEYATVQMARETVIGAPAQRVFTLERESRRVILRFDEKAGLLRQAILTQGNIEIREDYRGLRVNPRLPADLWRFVPPRGFRDEDAQGAAIG